MIFWIFLKNSCPFSLAVFGRAHLNRAIEKLSYMTPLCVEFSIEKVGAFFEIVTPLTLLCWFYYNQKERLSIEYFTGIAGTYAGYLNGMYEPEQGGREEAAIILRIIDIDNDGYFRGEFEHIEREVTNYTTYRRTEGLYMFLGKMDFSIYREKTRNPLVAKENRIYTGKLYVVDRLDFLFEQQDIKDFTRAEYGVTHYREMKTLKFVLEKNYDKNTKRPKEFTLYRKMGLKFEPYSTIKTIFDFK
jgi:hypothetical protein